MEKSKKILKAKKTVEYKKLVKCVQSATKYLISKEREKCAKSATVKKGA